MQQIFSQLVIESEALCAQATAPGIPIETLDAGHVGHAGYATKGRSETCLECVKRPRMIVEIRHEDLVLWWICRLRIKLVCKSDRCQLGEKEREI